MATDKEQIYKVRFHRDALLKELRAVCKHLPDLAKLLANYEATGDHNHGDRDLRPGEPCEGGDCWVAKTRALLDAMVASPGIGSYNEPRAWRIAEERGENPFKGIR